MPIKKVKCIYCDGTGIREIESVTWGLFCGDKKEIRKEKCKECEGIGQIEELFCKNCNYNSYADLYPQQCPHCYRDTEKTDRRRGL